MITPTTRVESSVFTDATFVDDGSVQFDTISTQVHETAALLHELRAERYYDREGVFTVEANAILDDVPVDTNLLWEEQIEYITAMLDMKWEQIYNSVLYSEQRSRWRTKDTIPDGRLAWDRAPDAFETFYTPSGTKLVWNTERLGHSNVATDGGLTADKTTIDLPLGEHPTTLPIAAEQDIEADLRTRDRIWVGYPLDETTHPTPDEYTLADPLHVRLESLGFYGDREFVPMDEYEPESVSERRAASQAQSETEDVQRMSERERMQTLVGILTNGYLSVEEQIRVMIYVTGQREAVALQYGDSSPQLITAVADLLDASLTHIPQTGYVVLSPEPLDQLQGIAQKFPTVQHLGRDEIKSVYESLDLPTETVLHRLDVGEFRRTTECLAQMLDADEIEEDDLWFYQLAGYTPAPETDEIINAIRTGDQNLRLFDQFDKQYGTAVGPHIRERVLDETYLDWTLAM